MRNMLRGMLVVVAALMLSACDKSGADDAAVKVALVTKGASGYWKSMQAGALQAGRDLGVEIVLKAPSIENDRTQQIDIVEGLIRDNISGLVLAPANAQALVKPVEAANARRIPVVIVDSPLNHGELINHVSYISTDNLKGGVLAGEKLSTLLGGVGKVILFRYSAGVAATNEREEGFLSAMHAYSGITVVGQDRYAGATLAEAENTATEMMDQIKRADGVFCPNEISTEGLVRALKKSQWSGHVKVIGFDTTPVLLDALKSGQVDALVSQDPYKMGYEGVKSVVAAVHGQSVQPSLDTGVRLITQQDLANPEMQKFLAR